MTPSRLGPYIVERPLGKGGMATVLLVRHEMTGARYALKLLTGSQSDFDAHQRFEREARALATLSGHPHIVSVHAYGFEGGTAWYVMDLVEGLPVDEVVKRHGPLSVRAAVKLGTQMANALAAAHAQGILHRDVKPQNIFIVGDLEKSDGRALLCDFGLALVADDDRLTRTGEIIGTPAFVAPEQARRQPQGPPVDIFGLGGVLHFALSGKIAHGDGANNWMAVVRAVLEDQPVPLRRVRPEVPEELESVVLRCLAKDPAGRYPSAGVLEFALLDCLRAGKKSRRRTGAILTLALFLGGVAAAVGLRGKTTDALTDPGTARPVSSSTPGDRQPARDPRPWDKRLDLAREKQKSDVVAAARIAIGVYPRVVDGDEERHALEQFFGKAVGAAKENAGTVALVGLRAGLDLRSVRASLGTDAQQAIFARILSTSPPPGHALRVALRDCLLASIAAHGSTDDGLRGEAGLRMRPEPPKANRPSFTDVADRNAWLTQPFDQGPEAQLANARNYARAGKTHEADGAIRDAVLAGADRFPDALEAARIQLRIAQDPIGALHALDQKDRTPRLRILHAEAQQAVAVTTREPASEDAAVREWEALAVSGESDFALRTFAYASLARLEATLGHAPAARAWYTRGVEALDGGFQEFEKLTPQIFAGER